MVNAGGRRWGRWGSLTGYGIHEEVEEREFDLDFTFCLFWPVMSSVLWELKIDDTLYIYGMLLNSKSEIISIDILC